mmetsp:Transcript_71258/g.159540  ORF Transcript_71258/g.159540 Transcript_71258/m.159540 type:complete len:308 (+) Transcript_71258:412-1335(+)
MVTGRSTIVTLGRTLPLPLLSPVTAKEPSKAPREELSSRRSPMRSKMSSKAIFVTSTPPTDFTTQPLCTPFLQAWARGSPLYRSSSFIAMTRAPLPLGPGAYLRMPKGRTRNSISCVPSTCEGSVGSKSSPRERITSGAMVSSVPTQPVAWKGPSLAQAPAPKSMSFTVGLLGSGLEPVQRRMLSVFRSRWMTRRACRCCVAATTCLKMCLALPSSILPSFEIRSPSSPPLASSSTIIFQRGQPATSPSMSTESTSCTMFGCGPMCRCTSISSSSLPRICSRLLSSCMRHMGITFTARLVPVWSLHS